LELEASTNIRSGTPGIDEGIRLIREGNSDVLEEGDVLLSPS